MGYNYQPKKHQVLCIPHMHAMLDHKFTSLVYYDWLRLQPQQTITEGAIREVQRYITSPPFFNLTTTTKSWRFWKTIKPSVLKVMGSLLTCYKFSFTGFLTCRPLCVTYGAEPLPSDLSRTAAGPFLVSPSVIVGSWSSLKTSPEEDCGAVSVSGVSDICSGSGCWSVLALRRR